MKVSTRTTVKEQTHVANQLKTRGEKRTWLTGGFLVVMMLFSMIGRGQLLVQDFGFSGALNANGWTVHSGGGTNPISTTTGLTYTGFPGSGIGNAALVSNLGGEDVNITFANQNTNGQSIYYSALVDVTDGAATKSGDYFLHIGTPGGATFTNFAARVFVRITASGVNFGINNTSTAAYGLTNFAKNAVYLVIVKYTINTAGNDAASLWVITSGVPLTEAAAGTAELTAATAGTDAINTIALRQGSATTSVQTVVDGIRVGTTWSSVVQNPPSITPTGTLAAVNTTYGSPSASPTSFSVSGSNLTNDILVTPPAGYEVSQTSGGGSGYAATQTLTQTGGSVGPVTVYARLTQTATVAGSPYSGNIVLSSTGVSPSVNVATVSSTVSPLTVTTSGATAVDKVYDRNTTATITGATVPGTVNGDIITVTGGGTFADFLVGNIKPVTAALGLSGTNATSYSLTQPTGLTANITQAPLSISGAQAQNKVFDGNTDAVITGTLSGIISPDVVTLNGTGTFASSAVGNNIAVTSTSTLGGADQANYSLIQPTGLTANITPAGLTPQTITFTLSPAATYGDAPITLNGTASSGLTVSYISTNTAVATIAGNILTIVGAGSTNIIASQPGDGTYDAAPDVTQPLTVSQKTITITGAVAQNKVYDGNATATIDLTGASLVGVIVPDVVTVSGGGTFADANVANGIVVTGTLSLGGADGFKYTLTQPVLSANITQASQTITGLPATDTRAFGIAPYNLTATGGASGQPVTYISSNTSVATISGNTVTIVAAGSTTITASQAGNTNYAAAPDALQTLTVTQASQAITFNALPNKLTTDAPFALTATSSSGLLVSYSSSNPAVATIAGSTVTIVGPGTTTITATQGGNTNYAAATPVQQPQLVVPVIPFAPVPMASQPGKSYTETFADISTWGNDFGSGAGAQRWKSVPIGGIATIPDPTRITTNLVFSSSSSGGAQRGSAQVPATTTIVLLSTGGTDNSSSTAIDFYMDFTGEIADKLSFDAATVFNSTGDRGGALRVYASVDGTTWTEFTGTNLPYLATNNVAGSASISNIQLPATFNNNANARLRFYYHNASNGNATGSRPKISIDNLTVTALLPPVINSSLTANATVGVPFTYTITATNSPTSFSSATLPVNGLSIAAAVISGTPTTAGLQNVAITATNGAGSDNQTLAITVAMGSQAITGLTATDTRTYGDAPYNLTATGGASGNPVTYVSSDPSVATISGNTVTIVAVGTTTITASQAGNSNYNAAPDVSQTLTVNKANQTITFAALPDKLDTDPAFTLNATGGASGNPVTYISSDPLVATISGNTVTIVGPGNTLITASQAGNANYNAATDVSQNQHVVNTNLLPQTITFNTLANKTYGDAPFQLTATGGASGNPVTYVSSNTAVATIAGDMVTIVGPGTTNITASQAGDVNYNPATPVTQPFTVDPKQLTVTGAIAQNKVYDGNTTAAIDLTGASLVGIVVPDVVSVSGGGTFADPNVANGIAVTANLTLGGADAFKYTLTQPTGLAANITQASQTITFGALAPKTASDVPFSLTATSSSGLTVTYLSSNPAVATVSGNTVTIVGVGSTTITAQQAGNINYSAAADVPQTLVVTQGSQTITFGALPAKFTTDPPFALTATASSGLTVTYNSSNPAVATVSGNTVTIVGAGSTVITASQAGNANFTAATPVPQTLNVTQPFAPVPMAAQPLRKYTENFNDIANWLNGFTGGIGANRWLPVAAIGGTIPSATGTTVSTATFSSGTSAGVQRGSAQAPATTSIVLLAINSTDNITGSAIDFFMDYTGLIADTLHFDATTVFNSTGNRVATLHVYASTDGISWTELTGTNLPYIATNNVAGSALINAIPLPASFNNSPTARLRFYIHNGSGGTTGSRPKISIDNLVVTAINAPVITSSLTDNATVDAAYSYNITATNSPASYNATGLPAGLNINTGSGAITGAPTVAGTFNISIQATNAGGTDTKTLVLTIAKANQTITGLPATDTRTYGDAPYNLTATGGASGNPVTYVSSDPLVATISGNTVTITGGGTATITASQAGNTNYNAAPDVFQVLTVNKANQTITFGALPPKVDTDPAFALTATASSGLTVSYASSNLSVATISGNTVTIVGPGTTNITASQAGNNSYNAAADVVQQQIVYSSTAQNQTITFNTLANKTYGDAPFQLTATASSNLTVTYVSSNPAVATISGDMVTIVGPGTTNITASQSGDFVNYNPAPDVTQPLTIDPKPLTVSGAIAQNKVYDGNTTATIDLTGASLVGVIVPDVVTFSGSGTFASANVGTSIPVTANLVLGGADASKYTLTQPTGLAADITIASQSITFGALAPKITTDVPFALTATASSGLPVSYTSSNPAVATVSGNTVTITGDGTTIITASQAGNGNYSAATPVAQTQLVNPATSVVTWNFGTSSGNAAPSSSIPTGLTVSNITQGNNNGTTTMLSNTNASNIYVGASGQFNAAAAAVSGGLSAKNGITPGLSGTSTYFEFTLTPDLHKKVTLSSISFGSRSTGTGPQSYSVRSSPDDYAADLATGTTTTPNVWGLRNPATTSSTSNFATPVTYRIYGYDGVGAVANTANWRIDDVSLDLQLLSAPPCSGIPDAGTASAGTGAFCASGSTTITLTGYTDPSSVTGISLQWYSSTDNVNFNPVALETNPTLATGTITQTMYYYCIVSCAASGQSATSNTVTVTVTPTPAAPSIAVVNNHDGTSTLTASGFTGSLLWSTTQTINPITVNTAGTYTVTQTINGCISPAGSANVAPDIDADPAITGLDLTDLSDVSIPNANAAPYNQVLKLKVPVFNTNPDNSLPAGSTTLRIDLGSKFVVDPGFTLATAPLNNYFNWTQTIVSGHVVILGSQYADIPGDFVGMAIFQVVANTSCASQVSANFIVDNHASTIILVDEDASNNAASLLYSVIVPAPTVSVTQPTCATATGIITVTAPTAAGMTYSIDGVTYTNTTGVFNPVNPGPYNVTAKTVDGCVSAITVAVVDPQPPTFIPGTVTGTSPLCIGATATYTSSGDAGGTWSSTNPLVASVNPSTGLVTALAAGTTDITYAVGGCVPASSFQALTVNPNANAGTVTGSSPLCIGATTTYTSNGDAGGSWSSTNPLVASVNASSGLVTALSAGTTDITYTVSTGCTAPLSSFQTLTVNANANAGTVTGTSPLCIGATATYTSNGDAGGSWSSTNPLVATVNAVSGVVTAVGAGTTNITYTVSTGCNNPVSSFQALTVNANANAGTVSGTTPLCIGATATYTSTGDAGGTWSSTNPLVATVNAVSGLVTAVGAGTTDITYTVSTGCNSPVSSFQALTVNPDANAGTVTGTSPLCIGSTATYTSSGDAGGFWSSTNPLVASVNAASGFVTALSAGTTNITYTVAGCNGPVSNFQSLTVSPNANAGTVSGTSPLCIGATATYTSTGDAGGSWSSTNPLVATVNAVSGLVTAVGAGTTDITYTVSTGCNNPVSSFQSLTVNPNVNAGTVTGTSPLCEGSTATYTSNGDAGGSWSSTNPAVASVNASSGLVTALSAGTTDITYTISTGCGAPVSSFQTLTVNATPPAPSIGVVYNGNGTATLTASGFTGTLLWNTFETTNPIIVNSGGTYTVTQTVGGCTSPAGSVLVALNVTADPAVTGLDLTDLSDVSIPDANTAPYNQVLKLKVPVFNLNQANIVPAGSIKLRIDLGSKFVVDPGFTLATAPLNNYFNWTQTIISGHVVIFGDLYTDLPADFNGIASFQVISSISCTSSISANIIVDNHASVVFLVDEDASNNIATMQYSIIVPAPTVSVTQPTCATATGIITVTAPTAAGMTYSIDGVTYTNTTGVFNPVNPGPYNVTAKTVDGCVSAITVAVVDPQPPTFIPGTVTGTSPLCIGATATYTSSGDAGGTWSSTNPLVASVNPSTGLVTALAAGTTDITYAVGGCVPASSFQALTVNPNANAGTVTGASPLCIGATATYTSNGDAGGSWSSTNPLVASVNASSGLVTALSAGTTDITYTVSTGCTAPLSSFQTLTVNANANAGTVTGTSPLCIGATATYTSNGDAGGSWSSSNPLVATVNAVSGVVTAVGAGTTNITYTVSTGCNNPVSSFQALTVNANANAGTVSGTSPLCIGATATYTSTGDAGGSWSSTNPLVATVNAVSGLVTAVGSGTTDITYTVSTGCNSPVSSFQALTVNPNANAGTVTGTTPLCIGQTTTFTSSGDAGGFWSSTNPLVASVNAASGFVTALSAGTTDVTYTVAGCNGPVSNFQSLTVSPNANAGTVSGTSPLCIGATATYTSTGDAGGSWSSTNPLVATVNAVSGLVTAVGAGTTDITYTVSTGCNNPVSSFQSLTVNPNVNAGTVTGTSPLCEGSTATYTSNGDAGGSWSSTNPAVASVNASSGLVTALSAGTTDITYTISTGCGAPVSSFQTLTVNATPPAPSIAVVYNGNGTATLTASGFTGTLLWNTLETTNPITVSSSGTYTVTQTVGSCTSPAGSVLVALEVAADPAVTGLDITDMSDVSIPDANAAPLNQVLKLKVPVFNLNQVNGVPAGSTTMRIDLGSKFVVDPGFTLATASLNNYFNWTQTIESGHVVIYGDQYADIPADFDGIASFQVISSVSCSSVITANIIVDNHASIITLQDEDVNNNLASLQYSVIVPAPVVSIIQPDCVTATGTITITSPTVPGMTYSINGVTYTNTTGVFTFVPSGSYNVTAQTVDGCISAITVAVVDPQPGTPTTILFTVTQPDCVTATGTITITSPVGPGMTYSIDGVDYSNTTGVFPGLTPGNYNLTVKTASGCVSTITVATVDPQPVFSGTITNTVTQPDCATATGTITITAPTAVGMTYSIDGLDYSNTSGVFPGLTPGSYNLTVKTSAGCVSPITVATVNPQPAVPSITLGPVQSTGCSGSPVGSITVFGSGAPGLTYTIVGPTVNTTGATSGVFTALTAGDYTVTVHSTSGCSNSVDATVVGPTGTVPDISLGSDISGNLFFSNGDINTIVYNISEVAGHPATGDTLRINKVPGYIISFNNTLTVNPLGANPLDNTRWKINSSNPAFVSIIFDPAANSTPGTLNCGERVFLQVDLQRNTANISIFSLTARLRRANTETFLINNLNSILFSAE